MTGTPPEKLVRSIGRWTLVGLLLNGILGSSVYRLSSEIGATLGANAWWAWIGAAAAMGVLMLCFAEVASRFRDAGGPYLYARIAFGAFAGVQMGWLAYLVRITASATNANLFVIYLAEFIPAAGTPIGGAVTMALLFGGLAAINYRGVKQGAAMSNFLIVAKVLPLVLFAVVGLVLVLERGPVEVAPVSSTVGNWIDVALLLIFAYGGFEASLVPLGEAKDPQRDAPFALLTALAVCAALYTACQLVVTMALSDPGAHPRPLAEVGRILIGPAGAAFMATGALLSLYGYFAASTINAPRLSYAMAERGDIPRVFAWVHPRFRTPAVSIIAYAVLSFGLALSGTFIQNLTLSAVSRIATYGLVCLAVPVLRRREGRDPAVLPAQFRAPAGNLLAAIGTVFMLSLITRITAREGVVLAVVIAGATTVWLLSRGRARTEAPPAVG